jgi:hypothetical protein
MPDDSNMQEKIQQLRERLDLQKQQVSVLTDLWNSLFPDPVYEITTGQFLTWIRKYEFDWIVSAFESGADWLSTEIQAFEEKPDEWELPGKINLVKVVSANLSDQRASKTGAPRRTLKIYKRVVPNER